MFTILCLLRFDEANMQPITATFSSLHENTGSGVDTAMEYAYFNHYFEQPTGTAYVFQVWIQPATEGPTVHLFSPTATQSGRTMGVLTSYGLQYCRSVALKETKELFLVATFLPTLQVFYLSFNTLTNMYTQTSWSTNNSISGMWSIRTEPMFTDYLYYIDSSAHLYKWDTKNPARDPGPGILVGTDFCRSWELLGNFLWIFSRGTTDMVYVERTTFTKVKTLTGTVEPRNAWIDNENSNIVYAIYFVSPWGVARVEIGTSSHVTTHSIPKVPGSNGPDETGIVQLGKSGYLGLIRTRDTPDCPFRIYSKVDLVEISPALYQPQTFPVYILDSFVGGSNTQPGKYEANFGMQVDVSGIYNFQSWKIIVDICSTRSQLICTACPTGYYIDRPEFFDNSCIAENTGHDGTTNSVVSCQDPNCLHCSDDFRICTKCVGVSLKPYIFQGRCVSFSEILPKSGINSMSNEIVPCVDPNCLQCRPNFQICLGCDLVLGYSLSQLGTCEINNSTALKVVSVFYDWRQQTATVEFNSEIVLSGDKFFLDFTMMDLNTSREYTCEQLDCVKQVQSRGVSVKFERIINFTKGSISLHKNTRLNISRKSDSILFTDYPVQIPVDHSVPRVFTDASISRATVVYTSVKALQIPSTLFFAAVHPSLSVLFDETFAKITAIAFYSSPPMAVLDQAILTFKKITIIPFVIPNLFGWLLIPDNCKPSFMLERYEYECQFAANFGVDLTIFLFMVVLTLIVKLSGYYANKQARNSLKSNKVSDSQTVASQKQRPLSRSTSVTVGTALEYLERTFGFMLLWARVEGKQAEYLVFAFQDFWSNDGSKNRILSTLVAAVCLLHVVFTFWGTTRLRSFITSFYNLRFSSRMTEHTVFLPVGEVSKHSPNLDKEPNNEEAGLELSNIMARKPSAKAVAKYAWSSISMASMFQRHQCIQLTTNKQLETTWFYPLRFWYEEQRIPDSPIQMRVPLVITLKNLCTALLVIGLTSHPKIQCFGGIMIEIMWFLFIYANSIKTSSLHKLTESSLSAAAVLFMAAKYFSHSVSEDFLQESLALWMLTIILVMMLVTALVTILSVAVWAFQSCQRKKSPRPLNTSDFAVVSENTPTMRNTRDNMPSESQVKGLQGAVSPVHAASSGIAASGTEPGKRSPSMQQKQHALKNKLVVRVPTIILKLAKSRYPSTPNK